jgi:hypothetical protein
MQREIKEKEDLAAAVDGRQGRHAFAGKIWALSKIFHEINIFHDKLKEPPSRRNNLLLHQSAGCATWSGISLDRGAGAG